MPTLTQGQIEMYARAAGLTPPDLWAAIAMAESSGRTDVVNAIGCVGLWQINQPVHVKAHPSWTKTWLKNPANNARAARVIADAQGLGAWEAYTNGAYKRYYKGSGGVSQADWTDDLGGALGGALGGDLVPDLEFLNVAGEITDVALDAANWIANPRSWLRVAYAVAGVALVLVGAAVMTGQGARLKDATNTLVSLTPPGRAVKAKGTAIKAKAKSAGTAKSSSTGSSKSSSSKAPTSGAADTGGTS